MSWSAYSDYLIGERLGPATRTRYMRWVRDADEWLRGEGTTLEQASSTQIAQWATLHVANSHSSRGQAVAALKHYWEMTDRDRPPIRAIRVPPAPEMVCRAIEEDQARDVVKVAFGWYPEGTVVLVGMYLALRRFEIAKMEWARFSDDLNWYTVTGKYDKTATLPVHKHLRAELATRYEGHRSDPRNGLPRKAVDPNSQQVVNQNSSRWVFPGRYNGQHVASATVWAWTQRVGEAAGVEHLKPHELRHTSLATANDRTGNLRAVQSFARHSKPQTTSGYTRTTALRLREVSDSLDYL